MTMYELVVKGAPGLLYTRLEEAQASALRRIQKGARAHIEVFPAAAPDGSQIAMTAYCYDAELKAWLLSPLPLAQSQS
jgi:hypothetical protein